DSEGVVHLFASLLKCADCGYNLRAHITYDKLKDGTKKRRTAYLCGNYARSGKSACTVHLLQEPVLTQLVLDEIREHAALTAFDEQRVIKAVGSEKNRESISLNELHRQQLRQYEDRLSELDKITRMLYEDRVNGIISEMMFKEMTANYERERTERDNAVKELRVKIEQCERTVCDVNAWIKTIRKYTELTELTREVLIELIDSIEVFEPEKVGKRRVCRIRIKYRFVGVVGEMLTTTDDDTPADAERGGVLEQAV
ncbi:MAG: DUF4368 domain-containing protein, partial [Oscillospiraceae bacterium]|nr:DUF4368 domain-containing protein [Oscillospiraceae bacterium]